MNSVIIIFLPLFSSLFLLVYGKFLGIYGSVSLSLYNMLLVIFTVIFNLYFFNINHDFFYCKFSYWMNVGILDILFDFFFDNLTLCMFFVVTSISLIVHFYSYEYMNSDPYVIRFFSFYLYLHFLC